VLAISVDSHFSLKLWSEKQKFNFPLLSDFNKVVCRNYGAFYEVFVPGILDYNGVAKRSAFVVDKNGIIQYIEILENALDEPNYDAIKETLSSLS
jgi:peroxiredoxin